MTYILESLSRVLVKLSSEIYTVKPGDTLSSIAKGDYNFIEEIIKVNPGIDPDDLRVGQKINIPPRELSSNVSLEPSEALYSLLKKYEGKPGTGEPYLIPYDDGFGNVTIGWGHNYGKGDYRRYLNITEDRALELLKEDVNEAASFIRRNIKTPLTQGQFDALTSLIFNAGSGNFSKSSLYRHVRNGDFDSAEKVFPSTLIGKNQRGLIKRRQDELTLFKS